MDEYSVHFEYIRQMEFVTVKDATPAGEINMEFSTTPTPDRIKCRDYMHLMDELTQPFEFSRAVRKYRKSLGITGSFTFTMPDFKHARFMTKYMDETGE
jgi:hypothetical protein